MELKTIRNKKGAITLVDIILLVLGLVVFFNLVPLLTTTFDDAAPYLDSFSLLLMALIIPVIIIGFIVSVFTQSEA